MTSASSDKAGSSDQSSIEIPAAISRDMLEQLVKIDRYELRARSRRKFAICTLSILYGAERRRQAAETNASRHNADWSPSCQNKPKLLSLRTSTVAAHNKRHRMADRKEAECGPRG